MLTSKQKKFLKSSAHHLKPVFQVGKGGVNDNLIKQVDDVLEARELIKVNVLQNSNENKEDIAEMLSKETSSEIVQIIGNSIVLYRESINKKTIELP